VKQPVQPIVFGAPSTQKPLFEKSALPTFASLTSSPAATLFGGFTGGIQPAAQVKPLFGTPTTASTASPANNEDGEEGNEGNPEEYEPQVDFKPIVKLNEVEVKTGEEDEEALFKQRCKLYRFSTETKEWKEKGAGEMKLLKHKTNQTYRILMRRDQVLKLCANHRVTSDLKLEIYNDKIVRWHAQDYSEGEGKHEYLAARFKTDDEAKKFKAEVENAQNAIKNQPAVAVSVQAVPAQTNPCAGLKPSLSEMFKTKGWTCTGCYVNNKETDAECVACSTKKEPSLSKSESDMSGIKNLTLSKTTDFSQSQSANNISKIAFGSSQATSNAPIVFGQASSTAKPLLFGAPSNSSPFQGFPPAAQAKPATTAAPTFAFGVKQPAQEPAVVFGAKQGLSFAELAGKAQPLGFGGGFKSGVANPIFGKSAIPVFGGGAQAKAEGDEDGHEGDDSNAGNPEEYEPQVDFKPLVKLQEVEVKTGEEGDDVMFVRRCKLYRYSSATKEWKEKGTGEIKVLNNKANQTYRILMRREQVLKLCANHRVTADLKLEILNEKQVRWSAHDYSENEGKHELLTAKFRHEEDAKEFIGQVGKAQDALKNSTGTPKAAVTAPSQAKPQNSLASALKQAAGSWNCTTCLTPNKPDVSKCAACQTPKEAEVIKPDELSIIKIVSATDEQIRKAREFKLPDNFYLYENKTACSGCRGCPNEAD
jgi:E3 SUMO-protein ligase RanBP2